MRSLNRDAGVCLHAAAGGRTFPLVERHDRLRGSQKTPVIGSPSNPYGRRELIGLGGTGLLCGRGSRAVSCGCGAACRRATVEDCLQCLTTAQTGSGRASAGAEGSVAYGRHPIRPVLKHGPRSLTCAQVKGLYETPGRNESERRCDRGCSGRAQHRPVSWPCYVPEAEHERICWYPKDGELCLSRLKPEETLVEDRSDSDVQIDRRT